MDLRNEVMLKLEVISGNLLLKKSQWCAAEECIEQLFHNKEYTLFLEGELFLCFYTARRTKGK